MKHNLIFRGKLVQEKQNIVICILLLIYTFLCGNFVPIAKAAKLSCGEYILLQLVNHYYVIYALCIYWFYWSFQDFKKNSSIQMLRYRSYTRYFTLRIGYAFFVILVLVLLHILIPLIIGSINLCFSFQYQGHEIEGFYSDSLNILFYFAKFVPKLPIAILVTSLYLAIGLLFIYEIMFFCQQALGDKYAIIAMIFILLNIMVGFKTQIDENMLECLFLNNYFILHHPLLLVGKTSVLYNLLIMFLVSIFMCMWTVTQKRGRKRNLKDKDYISSKLSGKIWFIVAFSLTMLVLKIIPAIMVKDSFTDYCFNLVKGYSKSPNDLIDMISYLFFYIVPIVYIDAFLDNEKRNKNLIIQLRYGSIRKWEHQITVSSLYFLARYFSIYWLIQLLSIIPMYFITRNNSVSNYQEIAEFYAVDVKLQYLIALSIIASFFELILVWILNIILTQKTNNMTIAFVLTYTGYAIGILMPQNAIKKWILFGDASLETIMMKIGTTGIHSFLLSEIGLYFITLSALSFVYYFVRRESRHDQYY